MACSSDARRIYKIELYFDDRGCIVQRRLYEKRRDCGAHVEWLGCVIGIHYHLSWIRAVDIYDEQY